MGFGISLQKTAICNVMEVLWKYAAAYLFKFDVLWKYTAAFRQNMFLILGSRFIRGRDD